MIPHALLQCTQHLLLLSRKVRSGATLLATPAQDLAQPIIHILAAASIPSSRLRRGAHRRRSCRVQHLLRLLLLRVHMRAEGPLQPP